MIDTKLVLIEGPPGSGKNTTAQNLAAEISNFGKTCQCFLEWSADHPIPIGEDLHLDEVLASAITRETGMLEHWRRFARARRSVDAVTVIESRFWQTSVMLMYAAGYPIEKILESNRRVIEAVQDLNPVLIYFAIDDQEAFAARTIQIKNEEWQKANLPELWETHIFKAFNSQKWFTDRALSGPAGLIAFLKEWAQVTTVLYDQVPFPKIKIRNPYEHWGLAKQQMRGFIGLTSVNCLG